MDWSPVWISLETAATATCITFVLGIAAARWMLAYGGRARGLIDGLLMLPLVLPPTVVGFLLLLLFGKHGPLGRVLLRLGAIVIFSWPATVIAAAVVAFPLMYKTTLAAFEQLNENVLQAGRTLGASELALLCRVMLPLAWPGVTAATALAFARALGEFGATLMLAGNIPGRTQTLPLAIFFAAEAGESQAAVIWTLIVVAISLLVMAAIHYWSRSARRRRMAPASDAEGALPPVSEQDSHVWNAGSKWSLPSAGEQREPVDATTDMFSGPGRAVAASSLTAEFDVRHPGFTLKVNFTGGAAPLAVVGASGSGKTMTLRTIAGLERPERGRIVLNGQVLFDSEAGINMPCRKRRIGFLFQDYALFSNLTVAQNVAFGMRGASRQEKQGRVSELAALLHLQGLEQRLPNQLSGGQAQRVALARALAIRPQAVLLDEPLSALDTYLRSQMEMQLMEALRGYRGVTLYVTHNMEEAYRISKDLLVLSRGRQVAYGPKQGIFERPPSYSVARVTGCKNFSCARALSPGLVEATDWGCALRVSQCLPENLKYIGIRAHHVLFSDSIPTERITAPSERKPGAESGSGSELGSRLSSVTVMQAGTAGEENTFPCWLAQTSETPFRMTLYLRLHAPPAGADDYHLQVEIFKEKWLALKDREFPWRVRLHPDLLFLMSD